MPIAELAREYRRLEGERAGNGIVPADSKDRALQRILAVEAERDPRVTTFRAEVLRGRLVRPDRIEGWIDARASREDPTRFVSELRELIERHGGGWEAAGDLVAPLLLEYVVPGEEWIRRRRVSPVGALGLLRRLSQTIADRYGWQQANATTFILAGISPPVVRARVGRVQRSSIAALERVRIEVSPRLSPDEVREIYAAEREELRGANYRDRDVSPEYLALAVFAAEHAEGWTWQEACIAWNKAKLGRRYDPTTWKQFASAARRAYKSVTASPLDWRGREKED